jgi:hypothetical protein
MMTTMSGVALPGEFQGFETSYIALAGELAARLGTAAQPPGRRSVDEHRHQAIDRYRLSRRRRHRSLAGALGDAPYRRFH